MERVVFPHNKKQKQEGTLSMTMKKVTLEEIQTTLKTNGLPFKDTLSGIIGPMINEHQPDHRVRVYPPEVVVFGMIAQALNPRGSLKSTVARVNANRIRQGLPLASINTAAYSDARKRFNTDILINSTMEVARIAESQAKPWSWRGFSVSAFDGTGLTANDTDANQKAFPQHAKQKEGAGFPLIRLVILQSLSTGMIQGADYAKFKGKETGEMALARSLLPLLSKGDLLLGDRYYPSFFLMAYLRKSGIEGVFQSHGARSVDFRAGQSLGSLDHIVTWDKPNRPSWMSQEEYDQYPTSIRLREVDVTKQIGCKDRFVIVTTLLGSKKYSRKNLAKLYKRRWQIELALRDLKTVMGLDHVAAETPEMIKKEIWSHFLAYNALRHHIANAASLGKLTVDQISVTTAINVISVNEANIMNAKKSSIPGLMAALYFQMLQCPVNRRPGRKEPRAVKRRPKSRKRLGEPRKAWKHRAAA